MNRLRAICWLMITLIAALDLRAQDRYFITFPDKTDSQFSLDKPEQFLSQRTLHRYQAKGYALQESDLPVSRRYLDSLAKYQVRVYYTSRWLNGAFVQEVNRVIERLLSKPFIVSAEKIASGADYLDTPSAVNNNFTPNDPAASPLSTAVQLHMLAIYAMHREQNTGKGIWVAVFDAGFSGVNKSSIFRGLFENQKIKDVEDFVTGGRDVYRYSSHGTKVLSCISANYKNQIVGAAYDADISLYVTGDDTAGEDEFRIEEYNWLLAAEKADSSGVDIISSSLGYNTFGDAAMDYTPSQMDGKTAIVTKAANMASERGILVVVAAGNEANNSWKTVTAPADGMHVLAVGSVNSDKLRAEFSSIGPSADNRIKPEVMAMGGRVVVVDASGNITTGSGTSFSCATATGLAAGLWQAKPELTNLELRQLIINSSHQAASPDNALGYGIPNYKAAMRILNTPDIEKHSPSVYPNPLYGDKLTVRLGAGWERKKMHIRVHNTEGQLLVSAAGEGRELLLDLSSLGMGIYIVSVADEEVHKAIKLLRF